MPFLRLLVLLLFALNARASYRVDIDLLHTAQNQIAVRVESPVLQQNYAIYRIPLNVEAARNAKLTDWITQLAAYDIAGRHLKYELLDNSSIIIYEVNEFVRLEYVVKENQAGKGNKAYISHIQPDKDFFLLNRNGFFGYFNGYETEPVELFIHKPANLYGATNLHRKAASSDTLDVFTKPPETLLHENLIMYAQPDTFRFNVAGSRFTIAVFSETGAHKSRDLYYVLKPVVQGVSRFLLNPNKLPNAAPQPDTAALGSFPVKEYTFLFYFTKRNGSNSLNLNEYGGLMCSATSSFYALPETKYSPGLYRLVQRMVAHELMHLFLPNLLHTNLSERPLGNEKQLTQHLWLYEGVTEYFALLLLLRNGLLEESDFWEEISKKIQVAAKYPNFAMTEASQNLYRKNKYKRWYPNFYYRGALAALLLDVQLAETSHNTLSLRRLLLGLPPTTPANVYADEGLIDTLVAHSNPQTAAFAAKYIQGKEALPYTNAFANLGLLYYPSLTEPFATFGQFWVLPNYKTKTMQFNGIGKQNLGLQEGDLLLSLNNNPITISTFAQYKHLIYQPDANQTLHLQIRRPRTKELVNLQANPWVLPKTSLFAIRQNPKATSAALQRKKWLLFEEQ